MYKSICTATAFVLLSSLLSAATAQLEIPGRKAFVRNEKNAVMSVQVEAKGGNLSDVELTLTAPCQSKKVYRIAKIESGKKAIVKIPVETRLTAGSYPMTITARGKGLAKA